MVKTESELDRLKREVNWLQRKHVLVGREHCEEMVAKDESLRKRQKRIDALERESTALKKERHDLQITLRAEKDELERSGLEIGHLKEELMRLNAAEQRVRDLEEAVAGAPNANLRLKIKQLLLKYHPDHRSTATLNNEEVTRALVELLEP